MFKLLYDTLQFNHALQLIQFIPSFIYLLYLFIYFIYFIDSQYNVKQVSKVFTKEQSIEGDQKAYPSYQYRNALMEEKKAEVIPYRRVVIRVPFFPFQLISICSQHLCGVRCMILYMIFLLQVPFHCV